MGIRIINEDLNLSRAIDCEDYLEVTINDRVYQYKPTTGFTVEELVDKFNGIKKHSSGRALQWLKKNAIGKRADTVTESLSRDTADSISRFILNNTSSENIDNLNIGDKAKEILSDMYGNRINYFTVDDTGIDNPVYDSLLDINNEDTCIWYDYYVEQIYQDDNEEIIKIECGNYDLILSVTDGFYQALNFGCTKEQLVDAIMNTETLTERLSSSAGEVDMVLDTDRVLAEFIKTDLRDMTSSLFNRAVMEYHKIENLFLGRVDPTQEDNNTKKIVHDWNKNNTLKKFQRKINEIAKKMANGYGEVGKYLAAAASKMSNIVIDLSRRF